MKLLYSSILPSKCEQVFWERKIEKLLRNLDSSSGTDDYVIVKSLGTTNTVDLRNKR